MSGFLYFVEDSESYVRFEAGEATPIALSTRQIECESENDNELKDVIQCRKWEDGTKF